MKKLKIIHIQKAVLSTGRAPLRLHNSFTEEGIDSSILSIDFDVNQSEKVRDAGRKPRITVRIDSFLQSVINRNVIPQKGLFTYPVLGTDISVMDPVRRCDVIYIHWVQGGYLNLSNYRKLAQLGKPVIFFMHDMWTITGGCHHSFGCEKYKSVCYKCPAFNGKEFLDWANREFNKKKRIYSGFDNLYFVSPSKWLYKCAEESELTKGKPLFHIPNTIDTNLFKPVSRSFARRVLNLNEDDIIIAFGAFMVSSAYKGWSELLKALKILKSESRLKNITLLIFGAGQDKQISDAIPFKSRFMGFLKDEYSTVLVYNAADIFVTPSLADNFPTTILECMACGTPVVGFNVGGIPDMIRHKENGYLAKYRDPEDLAHGIEYCLENKIKGRLLPEFERSVLIKKHMDLIDTALKQ